MPKLIDSEKFLQDMQLIYIEQGWDPGELHFSLRDLEHNLLGRDEGTAIKEYIAIFVDQLTAHGMYIDRSVLNED